MSECKIAINRPVLQSEPEKGIRYIYPAGIYLVRLPDWLESHYNNCSDYMCGSGNLIPCWKIALAQIIALIRWRSIMAMAKVKNRPGRSRTPPTLPNPLSLCLTDLTQSFTGLGIILKKIIYSSPSLRLPFWPFSYISNRIWPLYYTCTHASNNVILIVLAIWPVATTALGQSCIL